MSFTKQATTNEITLRGSTEIVTEFFGYSINSILYQRGIYPPETFERAQKYGISLFVSSDDGLNKYLQNVLSQLSQWLLHGEVEKLVVVIMGAQSQSTLERWVFNIDTDKAMTVNMPGKQKPQKDIMNEIQALIRQITSTVSFLPLINEPCTFDLLIYADSQAEVPAAWEESDPKYIANSTEVRLRSFTTKVHKVETTVTYKNNDADDI